MKKHNLFKVIVLTFLAVVVLTWIIPAGGYSTGEFASSGRTPLGLFDLVRTPLIAFANLTQYAYILLVIGGLYGVLNKTGAYTSLVEKWANKIKGKKFLVIMIAVIAILESLTGATFAIFLMIPFLATLVLKKGYGKVTAMASTVGALLLGDMASTLNYNIIGYLSEYLGFELMENLIPSIILLVVSIVIYSWIVVKKAKVQMIEIEEEIEVEETVPVKKKAEKVAKETKTTKTTKTTKKSETKAETKGKKDVKEVKVVKKKIKTVRKEMAPVDIPLLEENTTAKGTGALTVFGIILVLFSIVAMFSWSYVFEITFFDDLYTKVMELEIMNYPLFKNLLGTISVVGTWSNYDLIIFIVLCTLLISWIYSVKVDDMIDGFVSGAKQMAKPALLVMVATILYASMFSSTTGDNIFYTLVDKLLGSKEKLNLITSGIITGSGALLFSDFQALIGSLYIPYANVFANFMSVAAFILQTIYGVVAFVSPCSILAVLGLSYFDISYKEWFKYIWKFLAIAVVVIGIIVAVLVFA